MAEALLGVVYENLFSLIQNEFATISGIKKKGEKLSNTLDLIKAVLEDAEEKQITNRSVKVWLQQVKDAVYVLDDILDECSIQSNPLRGWSSFKPKTIILRRGIGKKLKEITERFDQIAEAKNKFLLHEGVRERPSEVAEWRQTSSIIAQPRVYGREGDKDKIVEFLLSQALEFDFLSIYPIVGLGGVGKTTLAQLVYNNERVSSHFNIKLWVCVSEYFSVKRILCSIIQSVVREKYDDFDLDAIQRKVQELLQGKRYLLVLDDVWKRNEELEFGLSHDKWNKLKSILSCGFKGSSILVSTRDKEAAAIMGTCQAHHLFGLSDDDCWLLFKKYAFGSNKEERQELVAIGKEIVKKCAGSPLAAQALGGLLHSKNEEKEWLNVKESRLWDLEDEKSILPALRLSYFYLTPTLKQCFAFCAIFPKDEQILKEELIHLWMANGFISSRESLEVEDVGNIIWNELYQKSLFQDVEKDNYSGDILFKMHDLVHDLAQSVVGQECLILDDANLSHLSRSTHHIRSYYISSSSNKLALQKAESLRTVYEVGPQNSNISKYFSRNCSLRILRTGSYELSSLENLIHLRYLELQSLETKTLPDSICSLQKLEILKLIFCSNLCCLPKHLSCLQNLRHLVIRCCSSLFDMFPNIGKLRCLRTLSQYIVSLEKGHSLAELHDLKLGEKLRIEGLDNVRSSDEAQGANLVGKKDLQELSLAWHTNCRTMSHATNVEQEHVLEGLQPHSNLKILRIEKYEGLNMARWMGFLSNLVTLELDWCRNCMQLSSLGKLPCLRKLEIQYMDNVEYIDDDECYDGMEIKAFPSLEELKLFVLPKVKQLLKVEKGNMCPRLSNLSIGHCPELVFPCLSSIKSLTFCGQNDKLLSSISSDLTTLDLYGGGDNPMTSFPEGMIRNLTCLKTLKISDLRELKEFPDELFYLQALESLSIQFCDKLECLREGVWEGLCSLRILKILNCRNLKSLPEGVRDLTSLKVLNIKGCPALIERCKEGTGEDWDKIAHVPTVLLYN
ncbi:hypothetical protein VNO77_31823 [Canavalia gladiata]|uniref:Uncharacterized protein n=1 Tax=Canavalia gladiata TaxID=3824 RepID=A0AAN9KP92_CANGL